jgi:hypothetical protein
LVSKIDDISLKPPGSEGPVTVAEAGPTLALGEAAVADVCLPPRWLAAMLQTSFQLDGWTPSSSGQLLSVGKTAPRPSPRWPPGHGTVACMTQSGT